MSFDRASLHIPDDFRHWTGDAAEDHIGPFFYKPLGEGRVQSAFRARPHHCNAYGIVHGGVLMAFADYTLCLAAMQGESDMVVTVSATCDFTDSLREGELLIGEGETTRMGGSLAFTRAVLRAGDRVVMTASGVIKRPRRSL